MTDRPPQLAVLATGNMAAVAGAEAFRANLTVAERAPMVADTGCEPDVAGGYTTVFPIAPVSANHGQRALTLDQ